MGVLSWHIRTGRADGLALDGLNVAIAFRYSDDEAGSPWEYTLYLDERADARQRDALRAIFTGERGGDALQHFPWAWKASCLREVESASIELLHARARGLIHIQDRITVRIRGPVAREATVTCVVPGHHQTGEELTADELSGNARGHAFDFAGVCAYRSAFAYSG
jgi:hypothetical protein